MGIEQIVHTVDYLLQVRSAQSGFPVAERVTRRRCPGCQAIRPEQWTEAMRDHYGDD
ncbi:hypothetical protein ACFWIV_12795 [Streptomyces virginiae]|uniref:hypothetical protein n=1 Tax=Streptomyces virginiae TaxID=1961 RepID=UPI0036461C94